MADRAPIAVPLTVMLVGALFAVFGVLKPTFIWTLGKVRTGRDMFGETGMTGLLVAFGAVLFVVGLVLLKKR